MTGSSWTEYQITGGTKWPATNGGWWPTTGRRVNNNGVLNNIGRNGWYWSSSHHSTASYAYFLYIRYDDHVTPNDNYPRSFGISVRCIEEGREN